MSALTIGQAATALRPGLTTFFGAQGGTPPYVFSVQPYQPGVGGAGGTIDATTGEYTAPATVKKNQRNFYDKITVTDAANATATAPILVGTSWMLVLDILRTSLRLDVEHCYFWDQKWDMPVDDSLIVIVAFNGVKPIASNLAPAGDPDPGDPASGPGWDQVQTSSMVNSHLDIHLYSRGIDAVLRIPEVFAALQSPYSRLQQSANGFYLSKIPHNANDLSIVDGDAIPYHFVVSCEMIWTHSKILTPPYFTDLPTPVITAIQP